VPQSKSDKYKKYKSLGNWCSNIRHSYKKIKQGGGGERTSHKISDANIQLLERMGFDWSTSEQLSFDDHMKDLQAFKEEHGHCNVPQTKSDKNKHQSLGKWCNSIRQAYKQIKQRQTPKSVFENLSDAKIQRLEAVGFNWSPAFAQLSFDDRMKDLQAFKKEQGHCNVPHKKYQSLGKWCSKTRYTYKIMKHGQTPKGICKLSDAKIQRLEAVGFKWNIHEKK
jgi:hypothetical protein